MGKKIELFDSVVSECDFFYNAYAEADINVNNGYNCKHPEQSEIETVDGKKIGRCHCFSCPLGYEADEEDFEDTDIDNQGFEYEEMSFLVIDDGNKECDICGISMTVEEYKNNNGFCQECANDRVE